jgi:hypothetical protein
MAKFYGLIGYAVTEETTPGIWEEKIVDRMYYGELVRNTRKLQSTNQINDNINIANEISILADPFASENFHLMKYVEFMGAKWKISSVEVQYPRLILTVGGVYNEQKQN